MTHQPRILSFSDPEQVAGEMRRLGSEEGGVQIMWPKGDWYAIRLEAVRGKAASLLKQGMLSLGGEVCVSRQVAAWDDSPRPVLLLGDLRHYRALCLKLRAEPFGLAAIAQQLQALLARAHQTPPPVRCGRHELRFDGRALVMGIINLTPDSFSGDGLAGDAAGALQQAQAFAASGADILDLGGESTRPGSAAVSVEEELRRVIPAIEAITSAVDLPLSIDSSKPEVCRAALQAGATLINDVWGLRQEGMVELAAETGAGVVIMHMQGQPRDMQHQPHYDDVITEVYDFLAERCEAAGNAGVAETQIILDPGFGFGKSFAHNLEIVRRLREFGCLGRPVLLGASRKRTLGEITGREVEERLAASVALHTLGVANGAHVVRVHDVEAMVDAVKVAAAVQGRDT